jgi:histidinol-phosphate/aromatic aminotransferase/cobyric acid decarboxylase-like protein
MATLEGYLRLCSKYNIHLISDEVYAKAIFPSQDIPEPPPFVSVLSLDIEKLIDPSLVHVLYGMSKDWCANGTRVGAIISLYNPQLIRALGTIASFTRTSSMAENAWLNILEDGEWLESYCLQLLRPSAEAEQYSLLSSLRCFVHLVGSVKLFEGRYCGSRVGTCMEDGKGGSLVGPGPNLLLGEERQLPTYICNS